MIQTFTVTAPLGSIDGPSAVATLDAAADKLTRLYPGFREATAEACDGVLTMVLRVSGRDRWIVSAAARKIASNMLLRVKIPADTAAMQLTRTAPDAKTLTKGQGRSVTARSQRLNSPPASGDLP